MNKQTSSQSKVHKKSNQVLMLATKKENAILTKALMMPSQEKNDYPFPSRPEQVRMVRMRTGNNKWNARMHSKLKMVPPVASLFGGED